MSTSGKIRMRENKPITHKTQDIHENPQSGKKLQVIRSTEKKPTTPGFSFSQPKPQTTEPY